MLGWGGLAGLGCWAGIDESMVAPFHLLHDTTARVAPQAAAWATQAGLSFQADYSYLSDESWVHAADRVWAVSLCLHQLRVLGSAVVAGAWLPAAAFTGLASSGIVCLHNGRTTASQREHEVSHAAWHLLSVSAVCLGMRRFPAKWRR